MKVSVVVPAYNEQKLIGNCLRSLVAQDTPAHQIIVVDNNSTDRTATIARRFKQVTVLKENQQGIVFARNAGFNRATGDIIARCDADSVLPPDWITKIVKVFETHPNLAAVTGPAYFYDIPEEVRDLLMKIHTAVYFTGSKAMLGHEVLFGTNMAMRTSVWQEIKDEVCLDEKLVHEDVDLAIHVAPHGKILFDPKLTASMSSRAAKTSIPKLIDRFNRWPKSKIVHTRARALYRV